MARPSNYSEEIAERILAELPYADGGLEAICKAEDMPSDRTVYRWLAAHETFRQSYAQARELIGDIQAQRALTDALAATDASLGRLAFDARKWTASKLAPKKYGDKVQNEHSGPDGAPIAIERIERVVVRPPNPDR